VTAVAERPSPSPAPAADEPAVRTRGYWAQAFRRLRRQPVTLVALALLVAVVVVGLLAQQLEPEHWNHIDLSRRWANHPPTLASHHFLGTDHIGRDVVARTLWGLHYTEQTALLGGLAATLLGIVIGGLAGFYGGWLDAVLMRIVDLITGFPVLVLMIAAFAFLQPVTVFEATLVFSLAMWTFVARVVRARVASLLPEEFVQAARGLGASDARIFFRHLLPNAAGTIIVAATSTFGQIVLVEATTEFFGFGVNSLIRPTLGNLVAEATSSGIGAYNLLGLGWWVWMPPAVLLVLILICVNLVGDGLDAALNPRAARR
jgi:ABC-type dipeptide/oligopeptide/nickel transport system permease subunit